MNNYTPYSSINEVLEDIKIHGDWIKRYDSCVFKIVSIDGNSINCGQNEHMSFRTAIANEWTYLDGTPFGKKEQVKFEYIDLGLSVKWASFNIGATKPEEYGELFKFEEWPNDIRVPSKVEFDELIDKCDWSWETLNGIDGYKVTSKVNNNSIFLPAAGYSYSNLYYRGSYGYYWSSTFYNDYYAWDLNFYSGNVRTNDFGNRYGGLSVRPVCE